MHVADFLRFGLEYTSKNKIFYFNLLLRFLAGYYIGLVYSKPKKPHLYLNRHDTFRDTASHLLKLSNKKNNTRVLTD